MFGSINISVSKQKAHLVIERLHTVYSSGVCTVFSWLTLKDLLWGFEVDSGASWVKIVQYSSTFLSY